MEAIQELKEAIYQLNEKLETITNRLDMLTEFLLPEETPELEDYLQKTLDSMVTLDARRHGLPVSRTDLANELDIHPNTAYVRAEKLVRKKKLVKYYGRDLGYTKFEDKKTVYYGLFRTLYDQQYVEQLENENSAAHRVALTLLQQQPLDENVLFESPVLPETEIRHGLEYLLTRGLIMRKVKGKKTQYRIRKVNTDDNNTE